MRSLGAPRWLLALTAIVFSGQLPTSAADRPNVLFIAADDLNDWLGCLQTEPHAFTPNLDRLAARGVLFASAHTQAPLCNPSRSSVLTGLRPSATGIYALEPGIRAVDALKTHLTLPQHFRNQGYFTATSGKIFHDGSLKPEEQLREFEHWGAAGIPTYPPEKFVHTPDDLLAMDWGPFPSNDADCADAKIADSAIAHLQLVPNDKPFFIAVGFRLPHVPCFVPQKWFDLYPDATLVMPRVLDDDRNDVPAFSWFLHWKVPEPRLSWIVKAGQWRPLVRAYLASITFMDSQVGRVLNALATTGHAANTIVVFWSDHGWHLGEKGITGKNSLWERSTHVPLIFAGPGIPAGGLCRQPVELLDIYPTLVDLCHLPPRPKLHGHSLIPQLQNPATPRPWPAITTHNRGNHAVRSLNWRYIHYADGTEELYNHQTDPNEWKNLVQDDRFAAIKRDHARLLPTEDAPPAPGSAIRFINRADGIWFWENAPIVPGEESRYPRTLPQTPKRAKSANSAPAKTGP